EVEDLPQADFVRFNAIGDRYAGVFISVTETTGRFGPESHYLFRGKEGDFIIRPNFDLKRRLEKAELKPGHKVLVTLVAQIPNRDPQKSPMNQFKVMVDASSTAVPAARTPPPAAQAAPEDD